MQSPSDSQLKAIKHGEGIMLVLAGPGSGKTFVMIQRLLYLIKEKQVKQDSILVISFSKASTLELKQRFQKQFQEKLISKNISDSLQQINFATFHSCFFHILKETYHYTSKDIISEKQKRELLKIVLTNPIFDETKKEQKRIQHNPNELRNVNEKIEEYLQKISFYKNKGIQEMEKQETLQFQKIFHAYNEEMHHLHKLDFDDMGLLCMQLFKNRPEILEKWQKRFQYVMIDEFQDINAVQFSIIRLLVEKHKNLFVVGDDDQSIYSFRGASPQIMLNFEKYYPDRKKVLLETNYRCCEAIVEEACKVIEKNKVRFKKKIKAYQPKTQQRQELFKEDFSKQERGKNIELKIPKNNGVIYLGFENYRKEYEYIVERIQKMVESKECEYSEIACIFRTNQSMTGLAELLVRNKIPFTMKEKSNSIFTHFIAQDLISYLLFFMEGKKREDFLKIMNKPMRYFSRKAILNNQIEWDKLKEYYVSKPYMIKNIEQLEQNDRWIQKLDLYGACFYIRKVMGYEAYLKEVCREKEIMWEEAMEILEFVHHSTKGITSIEKWKEFILQYEEALMRAKTEETEGVQILTYHACKGLEYRTVFLPDCNEGKVPHKKAAFPEEIEEERRMFYVAMTRAKEQLEILYLEDKEKKHLQPSRFLNC